MMAMLLGREQLSGRGVCEAFPCTDRRMEDK
jgi:hypothetical protein